MKCDGTAAVELATCFNSCYNSNIESGKSLLKLFGGPKMLGVPTTASQGTLLAIHSMASIAHKNLCRSKLACVDHVRMVMYHPNNI